ncbi:MAG: hypothetical protein HY738_06010 [Bacteroidia bacterium]|nr:hypothetical protein [Bacteroidia bacterium]
MKINVLVICSIIVATNLYSQQIVIPPSPTAASLGRYADIQVNLYTGKPNITIPIWEINENDIRLPIYLTYLADGIKVEEIASWIGFGWSLNAGGVITRSVRGNPDDNSLTDIHTNWWDMEWPGWIDDQKHYAGYEPEANFSDYDYIPYLIENMSQNEEDINYWTYLADFTVIDPYFEYELDGEPDIFYYNFLGHTGTFYFDKDRQISPEIYQPFQFSYNQDANGNIISFQIIDDKGFVYIFENVEETELLNTSYSLGYNALLGEYNQAMNRKMIFNSSWYLSKIETPLGKVVTFTYAQEGLIYNTRLSQYYDASIANEVHVYGNYASETNISSLRLSSIETDVTLINFIPGNEREDLDGNSKVLREIQIFSKYDLVHPVRIFQLEHGYFLSPNVDTERPEDFKRLYLISVQEIGVNNVANPPYTFGYNYNYSSNVYLPERLSFEQDLWGYYNANGSTNSLIPELHVYPGLNDEFRIYEKKNYSGTHYVLESEYFVDRLPDEPKMMHCILNRITYPTGGYRIFEAGYE